MTRRFRILLAIVAAGLTASTGNATLGFQAADGRAYYIRVVDGRNQNMPKVAVQVRAPDGSIRSFTTDDNGRVTIPAGDAIEGAWVTARGKDAVAWSRVDDTTGGRPGSMRGRPAVMTLAPLTHRVEGTVVDRQGKAIAGARVGAHRLIHAKNGTLTQDIRAKDPLLGLTTTDAAGKFAMTLPQGASAYLAAAHPSHLGTTTLVRTDAATVGPVTLQPAGWIAGRAIDKSTGKPVSGATVAAQLIERRRKPVSDGWGQDVTDNDGRFTVGGLEPGVFNLLLVEVPGRVHATAAAVEGIRVKTGEAATADLSVVEGRPLRGVVIDRGNSDRPVAGAQIGCLGPAHPGTGTALMVTETNAQGRFAFHVPPGEQFVYLIDDTTVGRMDRRLVNVPEQGELPLVYLLLASTGSSEEVQAQAAPATATARLMAPRIGAAAGKQQEKDRIVTGRVKDPKGVPLVGVRVSADTGAAPSDSAVTDREGTFIIAGLPGRQLWLTLDRPLEQAVKQSVPADRDEITATYRVQVDEKARRALSPVEDEPIPQDLQGRLTFVDLSPYGTDFLADGPGDPGDRNNLDRVPRGVHKLGKDYFRVGDRMVHLHGESPQNAPQRISGIKVAARAKRLHFLHGCQQQADAGTAVGRYVIHYADKTTETIPVVYEKQLVDWWHFPSQKNDPSEARIAWKGANPLVEQKNENVELRLFAIDWTNPHPGKEIASFDAVSTGSKSDPFLIAVTLEREK